jgi:flagellar biosynthesis GTPase FlhF
MVALKDRKNRHAANFVRETKSQRGVIMKTGKIVSSISLLGLLAALSSSAFSFDVNTAVQNAATPHDHEVVAKYYQEVAKDLQEKQREQKQLLDEYENHSYLYGRQAQDLQAHTDALARKYEKEAQASLKEAELHHQMALQLEEQNPSGHRLSAR